MADLLSLTGDVVGLGDSDVEDFHSFAPDTPHVMLQLADGRSLMVLGITRDEARKLGVGFSEPLTLSLSTTALDSFIDDVEAADVRDAAQLREALGRLIELRGHGSWAGKWVDAWDAAERAMKGDHP